MEKFKKGDLVEVICGKETGKKGNILKVEKEKGFVFVENLNKGKKNAKKTQKQAGGIIDINLPINISNVMHFCEACKAKAKIKINISKDGVKIRECKKCGKLIAK